MNKINISIKSYKGICLDQKKGLKAHCTWVTFKNTDLLVRIIHIIACLDVCICIYVLFQLYVFECISFLPLSSLFCICKVSSVFYHLPRDKGCRLAWLLSPACLHRLRLLMFITVLPPYQTNTWINNLSHILACHFKNVSNYSQVCHVLKHRILKNIICVLTNWELSGERGMRKTEFIL